MAANKVMNLREELARCAKCGKCRSVCPVFIEVSDEGMVARGRIALAQAVLEGKLRYTDKLEKYLNSCIKCLRCVSECPSGVAYDYIIIAMTRLMARARGMSPVARGVFRFVLPNRRLFDIAIRGAYYAQKFFPTQRRGTMRHLPLFFMGKRWIPTIAKRSALKRLGGKWVRPTGKPKVRVALFMGCLINYVYPEVAQATVRVLSRLGFEVIVPRGQVCCGTPVLSLGDFESARRLARMNALALRGTKADYVVLLCSSGGKMMKLDYPILLGEEWKDMQARVMDVVELISKFAPVKLGKIAQQVTYHDPCHLRWGQDIFDEPRQLLRRTANYKEMAEAERCCGCGGVFSMYHYDLSLSIARKKLQDIKQTGAETVATGCPGCMMFMADRLADGKVNCDVVHTIQIIDRAMQQSKEKPERS